MPVVYLYLDPNADPNPSRGRNNERTFQGAATTIARENGAEAHIFSTGQQAISAISRYSRIDRLIIFAHGAPRWIGFGGGGGGGIHESRRAGSWRNLSQFAPPLAERLVDGAIIGLAACTCGCDPATWRRAKDLEGSMNEALRRMEQAGGRRNAPADIRRQANQAVHRFATAAYFTSVGRGSFAYNLRDSLLRSGMSAVQVRAHSWRGRALENPMIIRFDPPLESNGVIVAFEELGEGRPGEVPASLAHRWRRAMTADRATDWILGGPLEPGSAEPSGVAASGFVPGTGEVVVPAEREVSQATGTIIPPRRTGSLDNSEGVVEENRRPQVTSEIGSRDELESQLRTWARSMENLLARQIG